MTTFTREEIQKALLMAELMITLQKVRDFEVKGIEEFIKNANGIESIELKDDSKLEEIEAVDAQACNKHITTLESKLHYLTNQRNMINYTYGDRAIFMPQFKEVIINISSLKYVLKLLQETK